MRGGVLVWGDVAFYLAVLAVAVAVAPRNRYWAAGIVLAALAFPLWIAAGVQLGPSFSLRAEARRLVTTGLYSKIRHPVYLFGTMAAWSSFLALQIWPLFWAIVALGAITLVRMRREEKVLRDAFGNEYEEYRRRTGFEGPPLLQVRLEVPEDGGVPRRPARPVAEAVHLAGVDEERVGPPRLRERIHERDRVREVDVVVRGPVDEQQVRLE